MSEWCEVDTPHDWHQSAYEWDGCAGSPYRIHAPNWEVRVIDDEMVLRPYLDELNRKVWEVEEQILLTSVVELLRDKGWTVEPPEGRDK